MIIKIFLIISMALMVKSLIIAIAYKAHKTYMRTAMTMYAPATGPAPAETRIYRPFRDGYSAYYDYTGMTTNKIPFTFTPHRDGEVHVYDFRQGNSPLHYMSGTGGTGKMYDEGGFQYELSKDQTNPDSKYTNAVAENAAAPAKQAAKLNAARSASYGGYSSTRRTGGIFAPSSTGPSLSTPTLLGGGQ